jgi:hypothetical protein
LHESSFSNAGGRSVNKSASVSFPALDELIVFLVQPVNWHFYDRAVGLS